MMKNNHDNKEIITIFENNIKNNIQSRAIDEYKDIEKEGKGENDLKFSFELDGGFTSNFGNENDSEDKKEELNLNN